jgi:hypothetical protein
MDGKKLKDYLTINRIKVGDLAAQLNLSRQTLTTWLKAAELSPAQRSAVITALMLPANFFESETVTAGTNGSELNNCLREKEDLYRQVIRLQTEKGELYERLVASEAEKVQIMREREKVKVKP